MGNHFDWADVTKCEKCQGRPCVCGKTTQVVAQPTLHFNGLTPGEAERLALLVEECGEVVQVIGKILRHGYNSYHPDDNDKTTNRTLLATEIGHVWAAMQLMVIPQDISGAIIEMSRSEKREKIKRWTHHQD